MTIDQLIFVGLNGYALALDRDTGEIVWSNDKMNSGYVTLLLDGDRLIVSLQGYTYCLDPTSGEQRWYNELKGMGTGVPCLASARGNTTPQLFAVLAEYERQSQQQHHQHGVG